MPDLLFSLQKFDLGHLRIVAEFWGIELSPTARKVAVKELAARLLDTTLVEEVVESLPPEARLALEVVAADQGKVPWAVFSRRFGAVREVGPGRRDRELLHLHPISTTEWLYYRALLGRAFFDTPSGLQEYAYIPDDLLPLFPRKEDEQPPAYESEPLGRPATPKEAMHLIPADDRILDDACSLLATFRLGNSEPAPAEGWRYPVKLLANLLAEAGLVCETIPQPEPVRQFLEMPRPEALAVLVKAWKESRTFDELRQLSHLICEGDWPHECIQARDSILQFLAPLPRGQWWNLSAFIRTIKERFPDFQRPAGDYDSWFIKRASDGTYLRGFSSWDEVEGALIQYFISGPLHWLGMTDLASPEESTVLSAFRLTPAASREAGAETARLHVSSQGKITVPRLLPRATRYQIARFCEWVEEKEDEYIYRVTPQSLKRARGQKLKAEQLLHLLRKHTASTVPPAFCAALQRWELKGTEARLESQVVLRLASPDVLRKLRLSKAARFLGDSLGPTTVIVKPGAQIKVLSALAELGLLVEDNTGHWKSA